MVLSSIFSYIFQYFYLKFWTYFYKCSKIILKQMLGSLNMIFAINITVKITVLNFLENGWHEWLETMLYPIFSAHYSPFYVVNWLSVSFRSCDVYKIQLLLIFLKTVGNSVLNPFSTPSYRYVQVRLMCISLKSRYIDIF